MIKVKEVVMSAMDEYIENINTKFGDLMKSQDLVDIGLFGSQASLWLARKKNECPDYIKKDILYYFLRNV